MSNNSTCPVTGRTARPAAGSGTSNRDWWLNQLNLKMLVGSSRNPMGSGFNYVEEFRKNDLAALKKGPPHADDRLAGMVAG